VNEDEVRATITRVLRDVAPDVDVDQVAADADLREEVGLDSMDILNFAAGLHEQTGVDVPERDYPQIVTLDGCARYLLAHQSA
jgi:acyl carrier protein